MPGIAPLPLTPEPARPRGLRYADAVIDGAGRRIIAVHEDHTTGTAQPVNTIVEIRLDGETVPRPLLTGRDFYAAPRLAPDWRRLAWLEWDHPAMPWIGCELWVGELTGDGSIGNRRPVAGGSDESIFQPEWSPDGVLYFVSDRGQAGLAGRWWNLFRAAGDRIEPVWPLVAEFGRPQWTFRMSTYAFEGARHIVCSYVQDGVHRLGRVDLVSLETTSIALPHQDISSVRAAAGRIYFRGGAPATPPAIVAYDLAERDDGLARLDEPGCRGLPGLHFAA
jgi:WD40-like Beta Propeller Repeat